MKPKLHRLICTFALCCLSLGQLAEAAPLTIKAGYPQLSGGTMPLWIIADSKLDQRYGVDVKPVYIAG